MAKTQYQNPYLQEFKEVLKNPLAQTRTTRHILTRRYAFAIPNRRAIEEIVRYSPILEIGAGSGYWASLIAQLGGDIQAFDKFPIKENPYHFEKTHATIHQGDENILKQTNTNKTLLLCWPPYNSPLAYNCLKNFRGNTFIYIGEEAGGCTGEENFHSELNTSWEKIKTIDIPQWPLIHDKLLMYKKKKKP